MAAEVLPEAQGEKRVREEGKAEEVIQIPEANQGQLPRPEGANLA